MPLPVCQVVFESFFRARYFGYIELSLESNSRLSAGIQTVEKGAERRKVIAKRDKKQTLPIK